MDNSAINVFFTSDEFKSLDDESKSLLTEFARKASGKSQTEAMAVFLEYHSKLSKSGKIGLDKKKLLIDTFKSAMSSSDRTKFEAIERIIAK